jgi:hypothetical protein
VRKVRTVVARGDLGGKRDQSGEQIAWRAITSEQSVVMAKIRAGWRGKFIIIIDRVID